MLLGCNPDSYAVGKRLSCSEQHNLSDINTGGFFRKPVQTSVSTEKERVVIPINFIYLLSEHGATPTAMWERVVLSEHVNLTIIPTSSVRKSGCGYLNQDMAIPVMHTPITPVTHRSFLDIYSECCGTLTTWRRVLPLEPVNLAGINTSLPISTRISVPDSVKMSESSAILSVRLGPKQQATLAYMQLLRGNITHAKMVHIQGKLQLNYLYDYFRASQKKQNSSGQEARCSEASYPEANGIQKAPKPHWRWFVWHSSIPNLDSRSFATLLYKCSAKWYIL